ncbi:MAG: UvrD-helicase domain-containing protein [Candidatus Hydrogenedentota bacterium]
MGFLKEHPDKWIQEEYKKWESIPDIKEHQLTILESELATLGNVDKIKFVFKLIDGLNSEQMESVLHNHSTEGPILILAGAGTGKTATLTRRVVYLLIKEILPEHILCMTFTNKAADEMKERIYFLIDRLSQENPGETSYYLNNVKTRITTMWISTFHSCCLRLLRDRLKEVSNFERVGLPPYISIIEPIEQKEIIKEILNSLKISFKELEPEEALTQISILKNELKDIDIAKNEASTTEEKRITEIYQRYQKKLKERQMIDFDDMIFYATTVLNEFLDVLEYYRNLFQYCLIDEYQDTNFAQYIFALSIVEKHRRLFAVGDDDQSIYGWRGADIRNILNFKRDFPFCKIVKMEKNYRSTGNILLSANQIFIEKKPEYRKILKVTKTGNTALDRYGERIIMFRAKDEVEEAEFVAYEIENLTKKEKHRLYDFAVLYRTNHMREPFLDVFSKKGIKYIEMGNSENLRQKIIVQFLEFASIFSDFIPLLKEPEKVGESFKTRLDEKITRVLSLPAFAINENDMNLLKYLPTNKTTGKTYHIYELFLNPDLYEQIYKTLSNNAKTRIANYYAILSEMISNFNQYTLYGYLSEILRRGGFEAEIKADGLRNDRKKLINNLLNTAGFIERTMPAEVQTYDRLRLFLEDINEKLYGSQTEFSPYEDGVRLVTLHSAKGLEFRNVFFIGLEEGICPLEHPSEKYLSKQEKEKRLDEEKRLFYVGVTRAMQRLYLLHTYTRLWFGKRQDMEPSRYLNLLPQNLIEKGESINSLKDKLKQRTKRFLSKIIE